MIRIIRYHIILRFRGYDLVRQSHRGQIDGCKRCASSSLERKSKFKISSSLAFPPPIDFLASMLCYHTTNRASCMAHHWIRTRKPGLVYNIARSMEVREIRKRCWMISLSGSINTMVDFGGVSRVVSGCLAFLLKYVRREIEKEKGLGWRHPSGAVTCMKPRKPPGPLGPPPSSFQESKPINVDDN